MGQISGNVMANPKFLGLGEQLGVSLAAGWIYVHGNAGNVVGNTTGRSWTSDRVIIKFFL